MKRTILAGGVAVVLGLAVGCGGEEPENNGEEEEVGYESCTVEDGEEGVTIRCPDGTQAVVERPGGCTLSDHGDGSYTVDCEGSEPVTLQDAENCELVEGEGEVTLNCGEETISFDVPFCGNGQVESGEVCDEGENNGSCEIEEGVSCTYCETDCQGFGTEERTVLDGSVVSITQGELGIVTGITLRVGGQEVEVDEEGKFEVVDLAPGTHQIEFDGDGWSVDRYYGEQRVAPQSIEVTLLEAGQITPVVVRLLSGFSTELEYDGTPQTLQLGEYQGSDFQRATWLNLEMENALVDASGDVFLGDVEVTVYAVSAPYLDEETFYYFQQAMPHRVTEAGDFLMISNAVALELRDAMSGEKLELADGATAQVRIVGGESDFENGQMIWSFDEEMSRWVEGGAAGDLEAGPMVRINVEPKPETSAVEGPVDSLGWIAVGSVEEREWTCVRGRTAPGTADVGAQFRGGASQASGSADGTFCIDVPREAQVVLYGQAHRSMRERFFGGRIEDLSEQGAASCGAAVDDCLDIGDWELEDLNGMCVDISRMKASPGYESAPKAVSGSFSQFRSLEVLHFPWPDYVQRRFGLERHYWAGPVELPAQASCVPVNWRRPELWIRQDANEEKFCDAEWANTLLFGYGEFMDPLEAPMGPVCGGGGGGCVPAELSDEAFFCGS